MRACMYMHICMDACVYVYVSLYVCVYVSLYVCMYAFLTLRRRLIYVSAPYQAGQRGENPEMTSFHSLPGLRRFPESSLN